MQKHARHMNERLVPPGTFVSSTRVRSHAIKAS